MACRTANFRVGDRSRGVMEVYSGKSPIRRTLGRAIIRTMRPGMMRARATQESGYPKWLPEDMRHTAPPVKRLRALLASIPAVLGKDDYVRLDLRARKIQHLCLHIDPAICGEAPPIRITMAQLLEILSLGVAF